MKINDSKKQVIFKDYSKVHTKKACLEEKLGGEIWYN